MSEKTNGDNLPVAQDIGTQIAQTASVESLEKQLEKADRYMKALDRIRKLAIQMTNTNDWVDENGVPYLQASGCSKIAGGFGVQVWSVEIIRENHEDDRGEYTLYTTSGYGKWNNNESHEIGTATSRDKFFAQRTAYNKETRENEKILLPMSEINQADIKKKSHTNFMNRLIKKLLGLSFTWEEIDQATDGRISKDKCTGVTYDKGSRGGNTDSTDVKERKSKLRQRIFDMCGGDEASAKEWLKSVTSFTAEDGTEVRGKASVQYLTEKQVPRVERELEKKLKELEGVNA